MIVIADEMNKINKIDKLVPTLLKYLLNSLLIIITTVENICVIDSNFTYEILTFSFSVFYLFHSRSV